MPRSTVSSPSVHDLTRVFVPAINDGGAAVAAVHARRRIPSSAVHWRPGLLVAASHTVEYDEGISATLPDGRRVAAEILGRDPRTDLAVLRLGVEDWPVATFTPTVDLAVGTLVVGLGRPSSEAPSATLGMVRAVREGWQSWAGGRLDRLIILDMNIRDGFSGGPLLDASGRVLGINTSALLRGGAACVPTETIERIAGHLVERGRVPRGYLGIAAQPVRLPTAVGGSEARRGLILLGVEPGGPAERAGLLLGDVLIEVDGEPVRDIRTLAASLGEARIGAALRVRYLRAGEVRETELTVGEHPAAG
jgi:S1-C subfamily serine protease